jgi:hypothetical protein
MPAPRNKAPALKKRKSKKLQVELDSGPKVASARDQIMRNMLAMPPKQHSEMKIGSRKKRRL